MSVYITVRHTKEIYVKFSIKYILIVLSIFAGENGYCVTEYDFWARDVPKEYEKEFIFLELLKWPEENTRKMFNETNTPNWDSSKISPYLLEAGVAFYDVNYYLDGEFNKKEIISQLRSRKGAIFTRFSRMSYFYSSPYRQYSNLEFSTNDNKTKIKIGSGYEVTFLHKNKKVFLIEIEYLTLEAH